MPPKHYQSQTLEQIINSLSSTLESDAIHYLDQARRITKQDSVLRDSQRNLSLLSSKVSELMVKQTELDRKLHHVSEVQDCICGGEGGEGNSGEGILDGLERQIDVLFHEVMMSGGGLGGVGTGATTTGSVSGVSSGAVVDGGSGGGSVVGVSRGASSFSRVDDADVEREKAYSMALDCEMKLGSIEEHLSDLEKELGELHNSSATTASGGGGNNEVNENSVEQVVNVLNNQYDVLSGLEGRCKAMERDLGWIGHVTGTTGRN